MAGYSGVCVRMEGQICVAKPNVKARSLGKKKQRCEKNTVVDVPRRGRETFLKIVCGLGGVLMQATNPRRLVIRPRADGEGGTS